VIQKLTKALIQLPETWLMPVADLFAVGIRCYVGWQFFKAGQIKIGSWSSTVGLFESTYQVPVLSPYLAAVLGTFGEIAFPILLFVGLTTRLAAIGLQIVNIVAMFAVLHFFNDGFSDPAYADHWLWGLMLLALMVYGGGRLSADELLKRYTAKSSR
jgi:putative oxidoreductase